ncbi:MAG: hypothetical protein ACKO9D_09745 [Gammaproteobacteria bacterium]
MANGRALAAILLLAALLQAPDAAAACTRNEPGYLWNFDGKIVALNNF